jgi:uncharacterized repeat protein (TIGR03803 family)
VSFSDGFFVLTITDEANGEPATTSGQVPSALRSSAEWIAEDPSGLNGAPLPFANFGVVSFGSDYTGVTGTCAATVGTNTGAIGHFLYTTFTMLDGAGGSVAVPSPLSSDGSSFQVTTQPFTLLLSLNSGSYLVGPLVQGLDGNLYGTTYGGGTIGYGTIFGITTGGTPTSLYSFSGIDGASPVGGLTLANNGNFYGTTSMGGTRGDGTVFEFSPSGLLTPLYVFNGGTGATPDDAPVQGTDGNFYGTTEGGGTDGWGTVFKITPSGAPTTLYSFCPKGAPCADGANPYAGLVQATNGHFYGTTLGGGANRGGTVFEIASTGPPTTLHSFSGPDGAAPQGTLTQGTDGNFYGTTGGGGTEGYGTVFKLTPKGTLTTLHSFLNSTDGSAPVGGLVQATDGNLYGVASGGGLYGYGTIFEISTKGFGITTLYSFSGLEGTSPISALIQATDGNLYGTTGSGGAIGNGSVFRLNVGLGPFVKALPTSGKAKAAVKILGTNLVGATAVSFNGTAATFTVVSASEISTNVAFRVTK